MTYGSGESFRIESNELIQKGAKVNGVELTKFLADNIIKEYSDGKETVELVCDISKYYDYYSGEAWKSIGDNWQAMTFKIGDIVIPMARSATGEDKPMSLYSNGKPKQFRVIDRSVYYDGAVWQKINLQEISISSLQV